MKEEEMQAKASEIAAELNNVLAAILGNISLVKTSKTPENERLAIAEKSCLRAAGLVRNDHTYLGRGQPHPPWVSVQRLTHISNQFLNGTINSPDPLCPLSQHRVW